MKIELGGGVNPKGEGFTNLDMKSEASDICIDFDTMDRLPFDDNTVDEVYSSHCLEHVHNPVFLMTELLRVCKIGAKLEIRVPHHLHPMASCPGHLSVISDRLFRYWCERPYYFWKQSNRGFKITHIHYQIETEYHELRPLFDKLTDLQVARTIPGCCHEIRCHLEIIEGEQVGKISSDHTMSSGSLE
jgi:SAM-dependent methyltransferase